MQEDLEKVYLDLQRECLVEGARIVAMGAWVYDVAKGLVHWSEGVYDVYGMSSDTDPPSLEECLSYYIPEDRDRLREALVQIETNIGSYDFECELITRAGVHKFVRVIGKSGSLLQGCNHCLYGVIQDISETRQIRNALIEARDQANAANQAKSNFLATVSHELRTPLNPILGFSDILLEEVENEEQLEMVRAINEAGQSLVETINRIIEYAELSPEKMKLRQDEFELSTLIHEVVEDLADCQPHFSVEVDMQQEASLPAGMLLQGDFKKVKCVLSNLLGNAAKFSGATVAQLRSSLSRLDPDHVLWHVDIEDRGVGIDPQLVEHIFDPFLIGNATYTRPQGGSGMGLAICRGYVELMDGRISVKSEQGEGATFSFFICLSIAGNQDCVKCASAGSLGEDEPVFIDELTDFSEEQEVDVSLEPTALDTTKISVLMVEDNTSNLFYQTRILEEMGYRLTTATDGQQALETYRPGLYDVILLDLHMPGIDGVEVLKSIREDEARCGAAKVPVIVLTADLLRSTQATCREYGADVFVSKPVNAAELKRKIEGVLADR
ncbi:response regulator [Coraliomargarita sp. SDUM461004]|uniref:histidine kinase n=1 Tax=Thalassobacterium sedimentorum TaxID=3041258 RepID=A0ABU1AF15_9BACT|nr:response regulator [Coraliomargarita sp. SDUM461004]MDQ8193335.1 response regulator [Coraliomargarita sp. SDUM461004]